MGLTETVNWVPSIVAEQVEVGVFGESLIVEGNVIIRELPWGMI